MITYALKLVCIVIVTFVGVIVCMAINDGIIEALGVSGLIGYGILMSWDSYVVYMDGVDAEIESEYMSDSWMQERGYWL
jgi:hypothetical protein